MAEQLARKRALLPRVRRVVIKIGSSILSGPRGLDRRHIATLAGEIAALRKRYQVILVSSGAVAAGTTRLGLRERPKTVPARQAAAAVGQIHLMALYDECFGKHNQPVAQILLTHDDLANRRRYLNARHTFEELLQAGVLPIVNENDTVAVEEVQFNFGDNDNLSALVATLVDADLLVILSDVAGLYTTDPRVDPAAALVPLVEQISDDIQSYAGQVSGPLGKGGMASKLQAARKANEAGITCLIADGRHDGVLPQVFDVERSVGTLFLAASDRLARRKHWIAHTLKPAGSVRVDQGAYEAIMRGGRSLLPKGITTVSGTFGAGDCVSCLTPDGTEFARGLVNYSSAELQRIKGLHSSAIEATLQYKVSDEIIHRDDLVLLS
jgi:glutamate 5-kinase